MCDFFPTFLLSLITYSWEDSASQGTALFHGNLVLGCDLWDNTTICVYFNPSFNNDPWWSDVNSSPGEKTILTADRFSKNRFMLHPITWVMFTVNSRAGLNCCKVSPREDTNSTFELLHKHAFPRQTDRFWNSSRQCVSTDCTIFPADVSTFSRSLGELSAYPLWAPRGRVRLRLWPGWSLAGAPS